MRLRDSLFAHALAPSHPAWVTRLFRVASTVVIALLVGWVTLHGVLNTARVRAWMLSELRERLDERLPQVELGDGLAVDWVFRVTIGPVRVVDGKRTLVEVGRLKVRPRYSAMAHGRLEPATVTLKDVHVDLSDGGAGLRRWWSGLHRGTKRHAPSNSEKRSPVVFLDGATVKVPFRGNAIDVGPFFAEVRLISEPASKTGSETGSEKSDRVVRLSGSLPGDGRVRGEAVLAADGLASAELTVDGLTESSIPDSIAQQLPVQVKLAKGAVHLRLLRAQGAFQVAVDGKVTDLVVAGERLSDNPVGPFVLAVDAAVELQPLRRKVQLRSFDLKIGPAAQVDLHAVADAQLSGEDPFHLEAELLPCDYEALLQAVPEELRPPDEAPHLSGPVSATANLSGDLHHPEGWDVQVNLGLAALKKSARNVKLFLAGPFTHHPENSERQILVGEQNPNFVPLAELPTWVSRAVTMSEDAGFFAHQGFDFQEMKDSVLSAVEEKRVRGASTITQQLAKNLFLSKQRTLTRKVREALITVALEAALPKQRLLEIYLNIIEWGPQLYGIGEAAHSYFGKDPRALSVKEAAFLATIIPNPIRYHVYFERGALTENWEKRVQDLLTRMHEEHIIDDDAFARASQEPLVFRPHDSAMNAPK